METAITSFQQLRLKFYHYLQYYFLIFAVVVACTLAGELS
jgi:hypothetical protein